MFPPDFYVTFSLRRSKLRYAVFTYLALIYPEASYPQAIATCLGTRPEDVIGALVGLGDRYDRELSLVRLGLVEILTHSGKKPSKLYKITQKGLAIHKRLSKKLKLRFLWLHVLPSDQQPNSLKITYQTIF